MGIEPIPSKLTVLHSTIELIYLKEDFINDLFVLIVRLELTHLSILDPKSNAAANYAI